jgi:hypothetical protein
MLRFFTWSTAALVEAAVTKQINRKQQGLLESTSSESEKRGKIASRTKQKQGPPVALMKKYEHQSNLFSSLSIVLCARMPLGNGK